MFTTASGGYKIKQTSPSETAVLFDNGTTLVLSWFTSDICRIRLAENGRFSPSALGRYGFIKDDPQAVACAVQEGDGRIIIGTPSLKVCVAVPTRLMEFRDAGNRVLLQEAKPAIGDKETGCRTMFKLRPKTAFFGLGDQTRERIEHRGTQALMWIENLAAYMPIPLLLTNEGYALLANTTRKHLFDLGVKQKNCFGFEARQGTLDYYFLRGDTPAELLERYTALTGRPPLPPKWSFGFWFVCHIDDDARQMLETCVRFREKGIPCDAIGLEPGWMEKMYDYATTKKFHPERFRILPWFRDAPKPGEKDCLDRRNIDHSRNIEQSTFFDAARNLGFKPGLWLCNDYDLSYEAERKVKQKDVERTDYKRAAADYGDCEFDEHLKDAVKYDRLTDPQKPWFDHLKKFVDIGVEYFKMDGADQTLEHPGRVFGNGMQDDEMHNLYPLLYAEQMAQGFREHTGRRSAIFTPNAWVGAQRFPGHWAGDIGGRLKPLTGCLNLSMCGMSYLSCDMDVSGPDGIHFGFLMPWAQLNSWAHWKHPWLLKPADQEIFKFYAHLRYRLIPYLYATAFQAWSTGMPIMRALPLIFPEDEKTHRVTHEYMLGDNLLVTAFDNKIYLPAGEWTDYWSGRRFKGPVAMTYTPPANRGGGLFVRQGAIIPLGPNMDYVGQVPETDLTLEVFPNADGKCLLYEDDGESFGYESRQHATTMISMRRESRRIMVMIGQREGQYDNMPAERHCSLKVHLEEKPRRVIQSDNILREMTSSEQPKDGWRYDGATQQLEAGPTLPAAEIIIELP